MKRITHTRDEVRPYSLLGVEFPADEREMTVGDETAAHVTRHPSVEYVDDEEPVDPDELAIELEPLPGEGNADETVRLAHTRADTHHYRLNGVDFPAGEREVDVSEDVAEQAVEHPDVHYADEVDAEAELAARAESEADDEGAEADADGDVDAETASAADTDVEADAAEEVAREVEGEDERERERESQAQAQAEREADADTTAAPERDAESDSDADADADAVAEDDDADEEDDDSPGGGPGAEAAPRAEQPIHERDGDDEA